MNTKEQIIELQKQANINSKFLPNLNLQKTDFIPQVTYIPKIVKFSHVNKLINFIEKLKPSELIIEPKIDGMLISITYNNGNLICIISKGNRHSGRNLTKYFTNFNIIPKKINIDFLIEIRGEAIISDKIFNTYYSNDFIDSRSLVSSQLHKKEIDEFFMQNLELYVHDIGIINKNKFENQTDIYSALSKNNFKIINYNIIPLEKLSDTISSYNNNEYKCDGTILKVNSIKHQISLLNSSKSSKYIIAFKKSQIFETYVNNIKFIMSKDGSIIPILYIDYVYCDEKKCNKISMYSYQMFKNNKLTTGCKIYVKYSTTFIYYGVSEYNNSNNWKDLTNCFKCNYKLEIIGKKLMCLNISCPAKIESQLFSYIKLKGIKSIGISCIKILIEQNIIKHPIDIFNKSIDKLIIDKLSKINGYKSKKINNIIKGISEFREVCSLTDLIMLLSIPSIGQETAKKLADLYLKNKKDIFNKEQINNLEFMNKIQKLNLSNFYNDNQELIKKFINYIYEFI